VNLESRRFEFKPTASEGDLPVGYRVFEPVFRSEVLTSRRVTTQLPSASANQTCAVRTNAVRYSSG
jgi:hypothetical protein